MPECGQADRRSSSRIEPKIEAARSVSDTRTIFAPLANTYLVDEELESGTYASFMCRPPPVLQEPMKQTMPPAPREDPLEARATHAAHFKPESNGLRK